MKRALFMVMISIVSTNMADTTESIDQKWEDFKKEVVDTAKNTYDGAANFIKGMGQSFGYISPDYIYSLQVWNDAPAPILAAIQRVTPVMGGDFSGNIVNSLAIGPFANSGDTFKNQQLYISVWLCADSGLSTIQKYAKSGKEGTQWGALVGAVAGMGIASPITTALGSALGGLVGGILVTEKLNNYKILRRDIYPWPSNDTNLYYYRTYTDKTVVKGEYLGIKGTTHDFLGTFYNNTDVDMAMNFMKDGATYVVTLEKQSYSFLQSTTTNANSIRPGSNEQRAFSISHNNQSIGYLPISQVGIANVVYNDANKQYDVAGPMMYTYEMYKEQDGSYAVSMQGLSIGNFSQPITTRVRDINPVQCHIWYQSASQALMTAGLKESQDSMPSSIPFDVPDSFWVVYKTKDCVIEQKIKAGSVADITLIRPQVSEQEAWLYGVSVQTNDDTKAKLFLDRLASGQIGQKAIYSDINSNDSALGTLTDLKPNTYGIVDDRDVSGASGVVGYVLFADKFLPNGVGTGPFYYGIAAGQLRVDQLVSQLFLDDRYYIKDTAGALVMQEAVYKELINMIEQWVNQYPKNPKQVRDQVIKYMQTKGNRVLFEDRKSVRAINPLRGTGSILSKQGIRMIDSFLTGPISIANYPLLRQAGTNYYVYGFGAKPTQWPL